MKIREFFSVVPAFLASAALLAGFFPRLAISADLSGNTDPRVQLVHCRLNQLTDIVFSGKIKKIVMSDSRSDDFKLVGTRVGSENHLIIEPLKTGVITDIFIIGVNRVRYLRVKTVPQDDQYSIRFDVEQPKKASAP